MEKKFLEVLNKWANYSKYDRDQTCFNLLSYDIQFHKVNKQIEKILKDYDDSGVLAILMAKNIFTKMIKDSKVNLYDLLSNPQYIQEEIDMYNLFNSNIIKEAEDYYFDLIENLSFKVIGKQLIGEENRETKKEFLFSCTDSVINSLEKCRLDVFQKGGIVGNISKISTHIQIFTSLANCLLALENAEDGMYLCYINIFDSPDSYFGFYIKNNGNIFSISERIDEAYKGSHQHSRNGRWTESKADDIFPYDYIFSYGEHDYKGYATNYTIDESKLSFFDLTEEVYIPILLAMIMIARKYNGKDLSNETLKYVDSLLPINLNAITTNNTELALIENYALVENHKNLNLDFEISKILDGTYHEEFTNKNLKYNEKISSMNNGQIFIDLWSEGFTFDINSLYEIPSQNLLEDKNETYSVEFVGSENRQRAQGYYMLRKQLANYIRQQMKKEFDKNGGIVFYKEYFKNSIKNNMEKIERKIVDEYVAIQCGKKILKAGWNTCDKNILTDIYYIEDTYASGFYYTYIVNDKEPWKSILYDKRTGNKCNMIFVFQPKNYLALEELFGEVPKLIKGWDLKGHSCSGNSILDLTDAVESLGTPFEDKESKWYYDSLPTDERPFMNFSFMIGYSKRGFKQMLKELNINLNEKIEEYKSKNQLDNTEVSTII